MFSSTAQQSSTLFRQARLALAGLALAASPLAMQAKVVSSVPSVVAKATSHGRMAPSADIRLTVWLAMPNKAEFDMKVQDLYTPGSPSFHKWLSPEELLAYAPTDSQVKTVKNELAAQGLTVVEDGRDNFSIAVHGPAAKVEAAFHTTLETFDQNGRTFHANTTEASLSGEAEKYVLGVSGLNNIGMKPMIALPKDPQTGKILAQHPLAKAAGSSLGVFNDYTDKCFQPASAFAFGTQGQLPVGLYFGLVYTGGQAACGWTPSEIQTAYGLPAVYKAGYKGQGQTVVIVDAYGSDTIHADADEFSILTGQPNLTAANFQIIYPSGPPLDPALGPQLNWDAETTLDVEWSHAIAPEAKIVLLVTPAQDDEDFQYAIEYATAHKLGSVISNSYEQPEIITGAADLDTWNQVLELAVSTGISVNFSSGDGGDLGIGSPVGAAGYPADSPYATGVGGTSIGVPGGSGGASETGWGNNQTELAATPTQPEDPPFNFGNGGGAGGGESIFFAKPSFQKNLPGAGRLVPDVAMNADPYTGALIIFTVPGTGQVAEPAGGTSLSCPMFSAYWALANQKAGKWLGQAAPILSTLPADAINDIVPSSPPTNVTGEVIDANGATFYSADELAAPLQGTTKFTSTIWPYFGQFNLLSFGTDTSLMTAKGWDDVTGYGTPNGLNFINAASK